MIRRGAFFDGVEKAAECGPFAGEEPVKDKRKAVLTLLKDAEWGQWSDREIARRCGVHHDFVGNLRRSLSSNDSEKPGARTYTTKHGTEATMHV